MNNQKELTPSSVHTDDRYVSNTSVQQESGRYKQACKNSHTSSSLSHGGSEEPAAGGKEWAGQIGKRGCGCGAWKEEQG